jgi:hypothetical protein
MRGELRKRIEDTLLSERAVSRGYFKRDEVSRLLRANSRDGNYSKEVFSLLALELWHQRFIDSACPDSGAESVPCQSPAYESASEIR